MHVYIARTRTRIVVIHIVAIIRLKLVLPSTSAMLRWLCCCCRRRAAHEPRARPELDRDETNVAEPRARPKLERAERWWLLFNKLEKVAKRKRLGNALFNTLKPTHSDFLANFPMTGQMLPDLRRNRGGA